MFLEIISTQMSGSSYQWMCPYFLRDVCCSRYCSEMCWIKWAHIHTYTPTHITRYCFSWCFSVIVGSLTEAAGDKSHAVREVVATSLRRIAKRHANLVLKNMYMYRMRNLKVKNVLVWHLHLLSHAVSLATNDMPCKDLCMYIAEH